MHKQERDNSTAMLEGRPRKHYATLLWLLAALAASIVAYSAGIGAGYCMDDFQFAFGEDGPSPFHHFVHSNPRNKFYRPFQFLFQRVVEINFGWETYPIQTTQIALNVLLAGLVFAGARSMGFSRLQAGLGSILMACSQANVHPVISNDTISQVGSTLLGCASLLLLYRLLSAEARASTRFPAAPGYWLALGAFTLSLFFKEGGISFLPMIAIVVYLCTKRRVGGLWGSARKALAVFLPFVVMAAAYLVVRAQVGAAQPQFGETVHTFRLGLNVPTNVAMLVASGLSPVSTVAVFTALRSGEYFHLAAYALLGAGLAAAIAYGLVKARRVRTVVVLAVLAGAALFPVSLMNHVSECYTYNTMPFIALLFGIGLGAYFGPKAGKHLQKGFAVALLAVVFSVNIASSYSKAALMREAGRQTHDLAGQIQPYLPSVPHNGKLILLNPPETAISYSVFRQYGFNLFRFGVNLFNLLADRDDFSTVVVNEGEERRDELSSRCLALTLRDGLVVPLEQQNRE